MEMYSILFDLYPAEAKALYMSGIIGCLGIVCIYVLFNKLMDALQVFFIERKNVVYCEGLHNGSIEGVCRNRRCPHAGGCAYFLPPITLRERLRVRFRSLIRRFRYGGLR